MTSRSTKGRRLGAVALGVGLGLLAFGFVAPVDENPAVVDSLTDDGRTTEATTDDGDTDSQRSPATVAGVTVTPTDDSATSTPDYSLMIIGAGMAAAGGISLTLSNRAERAAAEQPKPQHLR